MLSLVFCSVFNFSDGVVSWHPFLAQQNAKVLGGNALPGRVNSRTGIALDTWSTRVRRSTPWYLVTTSFIPLHTYMLRVVECWPIQHPFPPFQALDYSSSTHVPVRTRVHIVHILGYTRVRYTSSTRVLEYVDADRYQYIGTHKPMDTYPGTCAHRPGTWNPAIHSLACSLAHIGVHLCTIPRYYSRTCMLHCNIAIPAVNARRLHRNIEQETWNYFTC